MFQKFFQLQCFIKIFEITNKKMAEEAIMNKQITHRPDHQLVSLFVQMSPPKLVPLQVFHSLPQSGVETRRLAQKNLGVMAFGDTPWAPCVAAARWRVPPPFLENMRHFQSFPRNTGLQGQEEPPWRWRKAVTCWSKLGKRHGGKPESSFVLKGFFFPTFRKNIYV